MSRQVIPEHGLTYLRRLGDPVMMDKAGAISLRGWRPSDRGVKSQAIVRAVRSEGLWRIVRKWYPELITWVEERVPPHPVDAEKLREAYALFARYGTEIAGALLLAALPQSYASASGARMLTATEQLRTNLTNRIAGTANFLLTVMSAPKGGEVVESWGADLGAPRPKVRKELRPWQVCAALRVYHAAVREVLTTSRILGKGAKEVPLNQEDLLGMLLSFGVTTFEVLERYGVLWTSDQQEVYLYAWDLIGRHLGIGSPSVLDLMEKNHRKVVQAETEQLRRRGSRAMPVLPAAGKAPSITAADWHGLRPPTIDDTRALLAHIQSRQWRDPPGENGRITSSSSGQVLVRALLDEMADAMPTNLRLLPLTVMRQLNPPIVLTRLNLGAGGAVLTGLQDVPRRRAVVDRFTVQRLANPATSRLLRAMGNDVTRRVALMYLREGKLRIPGLNLAVATRRREVQPHADDG